MTKAVRPPGAPRLPRLEKGPVRRNERSEGPQGRGPADHCLAGWPEDRAERGLKPRATSRLSRPKARMAMGLK